MCCTISCSDDTTNPTTDAIVGKFTWSQWMQQAGWANYTAPEYTPADSLISALQANIDVATYQFIIFGSNWCHVDCEPMMPKIMKLLELVGYDKDSIAIYGLSRDKKEPADAIAAFNIKYVPTVVICNGADVLGTIVAESDNKNWEQQILDAVSK
ncbi:MAG: hypothetical protein LBO69_02715 [Ignavibacteria bacterium]|jgi:hypothetical protein|nr:hypothetical protein [Ignavibacteria bacterium]